MRPPRSRPRLRLEALDARWLPSTSLPLNNLSWTALGPAPLGTGAPQEPVVPGV